MQSQSRLWVLVPVAAAIGTFFLMQARCGTPGNAAAKQGLRIAAYNIGWLGEQHTKEREAHLKSVIKNVNPDIIALQEIENRKALERIFDSNWEIGIMDDATEFQEPAIAIRKPLKFVGKPTTIFGAEGFEFAFPGKRDVLRAQVQTPAGVVITLYVCHMKSRREGRIETDPARIMAAGLLAAYVRGMNEPYAVVLGDFNDNPDDASLNILESGNLEAKGEANDKTGPLLFNLMQPLNAKDYVTLGMAQKFRGQDFEPKVKGAREENNKWRGKQFKFPDDLAVTQILVDQILVSKSLYELKVGGAGIYGGKDALEGEGGRTTKTDDGRVRYLKQGTQASDHLPVYADFRL